PLTCPPPSALSTHPRSLHDALPICQNRTVQVYAHRYKHQHPIPSFYSPLCKVSGRLLHLAAQFTKTDRPSTFFHDSSFIGQVLRSEEHTSELQSRENLVCRLPLEKK